MMRITISRNSAGAVSYYTEALTKEDYFFGEKEVKAVWKGKTASILGLSGEVTRETFSALVNNRHHKTGKQLTVRNMENRRSGVEFCFNSPKSASIVYAITKDNLIIEAHRNAVAAAMAEIEADMQTQSNEFGHKFYETTGNIVYASFEHFTSRPSKIDLENRKEYIPDMHLHSHVFTPSVTWVESKGRYQAIETGTIHKLANYYEALYHSVFSNELEKAGYGINRTKDRWEIAGISREVIEKFSNRTLEIEKEARDKGITNIKEKSKLGARTRIKKSQGVEEKELYALWENRLTPKERKEVRTAKHTPYKNNTRAITSKEAVEKAIQHYSERSSVYAEKRVLGQAMSYGYGTLTPEAVETALAERKDIISADRNSIKYITTREMLHAEDKMLEFASSTKGTVVPLNPRYDIQQNFLNDEQRKAIRQLLNSNDRVSILLGSAGTGKSSLLFEVKNGIEQNGKRLLGFAPSANASRGVLKDKGFEEADTLAALLQKEEVQNTLRNNVMLIDEAGMVGIQDMNRLFEVAQQQNARIILSGDPKQHNSVNAGDALRQLQEKSQLRPAVVNTIVRQKGNEEYRRAIQSLAIGNTLEGYQKLDKMGAVKEIEDTQERQEALADAYIQSLEQKRSALIVSPSHAEGDAITQTVRDKLKDAGKITGDERVFDTHRSVSLTEEQKKDIAQYQEGMVLRFHRSCKGGFMAGQHYTVETANEQSNNQFLVKDAYGKTAALPLEASEQFQVYQPTPTPIATGDKLRITVNTKSQEGTKLHNGQVYDVKGFTPEGHIQLSNGKTLDKDFTHFKHGYVETSYSSQGKDAKDVYIAQSGLSYGASNEKQFYVSTSRGAEKVEIYTDNKIDLKQAIQRDTDRMTAQELAQHSQLQRTQRYQRDYYNENTNRVYENERVLQYGNTTKEHLSKNGLERE